MKKCNEIFTETYDYSLEDAFYDTFGCIDNNKKLCIHNFPDDELNGDGYIVCDMEYTRSSKEAALDDIKEITGNIKKLSLIADSMTKIDPEDVNRCSAELKSFYDKYLLPLNPGEGNREEYDRIYHEHLEETEDTRTDEEKQFMEKCRENMKAEAEQRIGKNYCAATVIRRAERLQRLLSLGAPKSVYNAEELLFVQAYIIHRFAKSFDVVC